MTTLRNAIAHAMADGSYDYEKTGQPQEHHFKAADRVIARLKQLSHTMDLNVEFNHA